VANLKDFEFCLLHYVPDAIGNARLSIAVIVFDMSDPETGICTMNIAPHWRTAVRRLDPDSDLEMLGALLTEIRDRLLSKDQRWDMIRQMEDSFSNVVQVSQRRKCPAGLRTEMVEDFARRLLEKTSTTSKSFASIPPQTSQPGV
jgi:hypothetical protein